MSSEAISVEWGTVGPRPTRSEEIPGGPPAQATVQQSSRAERVLLLIRKVGLSRTSPPARGARESRWRPAHIRTAVERQAGASPSSPMTTRPAQGDGRRVMSLGAAVGGFAVSGLDTARPVELGVSANSRTTNRRPHGASISDVWVGSLLVHLLLSCAVERYRHHLRTKWSPQAKHRFRPFPRLSAELPPAASYSLDGCRAIMHHPLLIRNDQ